MVRTRLFHCGSLGSFPGPGTEILQMEQHSKKKKKKVIILDVFPGWLRW